MIFSFITTPNNILLVLLILVYEENLINVNFSFVALMCLSVNRQHKLEKLIIFL